MRKEEKVEVINSIVNLIKEYGNVYLTDLSTLNAEATSKLRRECAKAEVKLVMVKNTLLEKALEQMDGDFSELSPALKGNTALMCSYVANKPAKIIAGYKKANYPALKAAYVQESIYVGANNLAFLENIKSKEEVLGDVIGLLQSPIKNVVSALQSGGNTIHGVLETLKNK